MKFGANLVNGGSVTFLPRLAPPRFLSTLPPRLPYYLHLFITFTPLFYKRNKKNHFIILLSQSSCHAPSNSLGLGPLLGLDPLISLGPLLGLGFKALSILYLFSITQLEHAWRGGEEGGTCNKRYHRDDVLCCIRYSLCRVAFQSALRVRVHLE